MKIYHNIGYLSMVECIEGLIMATDGMEMLAINTSFLSIEVTELHRIKIKLLEKVLVLPFIRHGLPKPQFYRPRQPRNATQKGATRFSSKYVIIALVSYIVSWSGGKESCFALYEAIGRGYEISHLVNFISREFHRVSFHGTEPRLIQLQSQALGIPLLQKETTRDGYEQEFKEAVRSLVPGGVEGMVFGDIYVQEHIDWVERVCNDLGIKAVEPLWGRDTEDILSCFIEARFEAVIVGVRADMIDKEWVGRQVDRAFMDYLKKKDIDICGENGEYHTLVTGGPIFNGRIQLVDSRTISRGNHWFLDTIKYELGR